MAGFKDRIGIDLGRRLAIEEGIAWAAANGVVYCDVEADIAPNAIESFDDRRCATIAEACQRHGLHLGLHTLSAVNIAEISPFVREAADQYLRAYIDLATRLKAEWVVVHGGYHFTSDRALRRQASMARLRRAVDYAEQRRVLLLLENLNAEPERAEVHYLADTLAETNAYFDAIRSPQFKWAFTINHAHYDPLGIAGFIAGMDMRRCAEVRLADNNGLYELHMPPGTGTVDFVDMFRRVEAAGFTGHYMCGWGSLEDMLSGRDYLLDCAAKAGIAVR
ncbi:MAG TPA: TIM barrel protein [Hyphomicrobiaceae bacterium]|nr:TIM barrel protein [Hyphomicrobiaceae bacterium]